MERSDWKSSSIISFALPLIKKSMLSLCECITHSSSISLEEKKLFAIVNSIFHRLNFWKQLWYLLAMV